MFDAVGVLNDPQLSESVGEPRAMFTAFAEAKHPFKSTPAVTEATTVIEGASPSVIVSDWEAVCVFPEPSVAVQTIV